MDYSLAGFTFHFNLDGDGNVVSIVTPDLPPLIDSETLVLDPAQTVEAAEVTVSAIVQLLGLGS
jgi:hypothetical protein